MGHSHAGHSHSHGHRAGDWKRLTLTLIVIALYMVAEFVGGLLTNSLALLADAGHMLSDAAALGLSLFALWIAKRPPDARRTYGYYRAEILAAQVNGASLLAIALFIFIEAYQRFSAPPEVQGAAMLAIAVGGLLVNGLALWILSAGQSASLNLRGAWLHVLMDALGSVGAIVAGGLILAFGWNWADPAVSVLIGLLVVYSSWNLLAEALSVLMESTPKHLNADHVRDTIASVAGVREVHDLHIWTITSGMEALSAHVVVHDGVSHAGVLRDLRVGLHDAFGIDHLTIQIEPLDYGECQAHA